MNGRSFRFAGVFGIAVTAMVGLSTGASHATAASQTGAATAKVRHLVSIGTTNLRAVAARQHQSSNRGQRLRPASHRINNLAGRGVGAPNPSPTPIVNGNGGALSWIGVTVESQGNANGGISLEPPDQGLCAAHGVIGEPVNIGLQAYNYYGAALTPVVPLNAFFNLPPVVDFSHSPPTFGPFLSDPRCYYDKQTDRVFFTVLEIDTNPYTGNLGFRSSELIAVSQTSDPLGGYGLFMIDSTNDGSDGTPAEANCPCFGDQPRIGADAHGFYISTDAYPIHGLYNSNGGELYAMSKSGLAAAATGSAPPPVLVDIHNGAVVIQGYPANAVQPAETPAGGSYAADTEYFLSTPDFNGFATMGGQGASSLVLWALTGTSTLSSNTPSVTLTDSIVPTEPFATPINATQKTGPVPYATSLGAKEAPLSVNDDRMQQVEYVTGNLYTTLNTAVGSGAGNRSGVAWFVIKPSGSSGTLAHQGYVALAGSNTILYPAIGLDSAGDGVMTFSISGPSYYPSAAFMHFDHTSPTGSIYITGAGARPEDGFTCYQQSGYGPACRWGDYSAASSDGAGHIVMGDEMISPAPRFPDSNWSTYVSILNNY